MKPDRPEKLTEVEAKGGRRVKGMPLVLGVSVVAAAILLLVVMGVFSAG